MEMKNLSKINVRRLLKNKNFLVNIGIIVLALIITKNLHQDQLAKINAIRNQIAEEDKITIFVDQLKALEDKIDVIQRDFPANLNSNTVLENVSSLARKNAVKVNSIDSQSILDKRLYQQIPIKTEFKADYHKLGHLISDIENAGPLKVVSLNIKSDKTYYSESIGEVDITLIVITNSLKSK